jgi:Zn-dependent peptidase ImmA (M78 family)
MRKARKVSVIREEAIRILKAHKIKTSPVPVDHIAEALGAQIRYSPFDGDSELAGMLVRSDGKIVIGVNSLHHSNRQRFTIAHECGHLLLHKGTDVHIDRSFRVNRRDAVSSQAIDPEEIEANRFAAELLMPYDMIMNDLVEYDIDIEDEEELKELADKYQVSVQALTHRITNLLNDLF